jgi:hypothetical protein
MVNRDGSDSCRVRIVNVENAVVEKKSASLPLQQKSS